MNLRDYMDYSMATGQSTRIKECPQCEGRGNSDAVQVTRKPDGFIVHCFRCTRSYFVDDSGASPGEVQKIAKNASKEKADTRPEKVSLPKDFDTSLPPKARVQMWDTGITDKDMEFFNVGWSQAHSRIIFPLYKYLTPTSDSGKVARKLIGLLGRKLADDTSDKPKWWSVRQKDIKHPRFIGLPQKLVQGREVVIVEDILSAIRISQTGRYGIALLTTYLPYEMYGVLRGWRVHLWLDADAYSKALKYQAALGANGVSANVILTDNDPKTYTENKIEEAIKYDKLKSGGTEN